MPNYSRDRLAGLCRRRFARYVQKSGKTQLSLPFEDALREIIRIGERNVHAGRLAEQNRYRNPEHQLTLGDYINVIVETWVQEYSTWCRLQDKHSNAWAELRQTLTFEAEHFLARREPPFSRAHLAEDFAQRACVKILSAQYWFDVPFKVWARAVLKNTIREQARASDPLDRPHSSLDALLDDPSRAAQLERRESNGHSPFTAIEERDRLLWGLRQISPQRSAVVILTYFEDLSDAEIARRLDKSKSSIYSLRHRALGQLSQLLKENRKQETSEKTRS